jgi:Fe-S-cluster containining protein
MKFFEDIINSELEGLEVDCTSGCSWCCNQLIIVTCAADGEVILKTAKKRLSKKEFKAFKRVVREQAKAINELPHEEAECLRWPCPLLKDGKCLVYDVRPVACRAVFSPDKECCRAMMNACTFKELPAPYQKVAMAITDKALRIQITINDKRQIDGAVELRSLLASLLNKKKV